MSVPMWKSMQRFEAANVSSPLGSTRPNNTPALGNVILLNLERERLSTVRASLEGLRCRVHELTNIFEALTQVFTSSVNLVVLGESEALAFSRKVRSSHPHQLLPLVVIGDKYDAATEIPLLESGVDAYITGPLSVSVLRARIQSYLRRKALTDSMDDTETILFTLAHSVEERDPALGQHCERLSFMAAATGIALGLGTEDIVSLQRGGFLHDIGKVAVPDSVLFKPGPLTPEEWEVMKTHPERGEKICRPVRSLTSVLPIIRNHHEKWDGTGYPDKLAGEEIPLLARILQMADIYDALTTSRPYKRPFTSHQAMQMMEEEAKKGWRDPELTRVFLNLVPLFDQPEAAPLSQLSLGALASYVGQLRNGGQSSGSLYAEDPAGSRFGL